jgi:ATP-dependent protease ClpP protease subunit
VCSSDLKYFSADEAKAYGLVDLVAEFPEKGKR